MLHIEIKGSRGGITARGLKVALDATLRMLAEIDVGVSRSPAGTTDWMIGQIRSGSLLLDLTPRTRGAASEFGHEITHTYVEGLGRLEREGSSPPYLSEAGLRSAKQFVRLIGREGITGLNAANETVEADLTLRASQNVEQLLHEGPQSIGSVEGRLETISLHGRPRFVVYHAVSRKAVVCRFDPVRWLEPAKSSLGHRVNVAGIVHHNLRGEPARVEVERIRVLGPAAQLAPLTALTGADRGFTGELSTEEYLQSIRG